MSDGDAMIVRRQRPWIHAAATAALFGSLVAAHGTQNRVTPRMIERMIDRYGTQRTVKILTSAHAKPENLGDYDKVLDGISSGDASWVALAPKLFQGANTAASESLVISVAEALPKNPAAVLRLIARHPSWREACTYPMIEPTDKEARIYFRRAIPGVRSVSNPALRVARDTTSACCECEA